MDEEKNEYINLNEAKTKVYRTLKVCFAKRIKTEKKIKSAVNTITMWIKENTILLLFNSLKLKAQLIQSSGSSFNTVFY